MKEGFDVSRYQGDINFAATKAAGKDFVLIRAGYGRLASQEDPYFARNYTAAKAAGLRVGAYWYSYATTTQGAVKEANTCLAVLGNRSFDLPVFFDQEYEPGITALTNAQRTAIVRAFIEQMEKAGYTSGLYCSTDWYNNRLTRTELVGINLWIAQYADELTVEAEPQLWQYSSTGRINGISGNVDLDQELRCNYRQNTVYQPEPSKTNEEIALEVIDGLWGNGEERRQRLTAAGYDYDAIQAIVNEILAEGYRKNNEEIALEVIQGDWGNGTARRQRLTEAGYSYNEVQTLVNQLLAGQKKSNTQLAREVIRGEWGNGDERRQRLTNAGHDYSAVQALVNQMV